MTLTDSQTGAASATSTAVLYRMVTPQHTCPFGLRALHLLRSNGYEVEDRPLRSRAEQEAFKAKHDVKTTPQVFIDGARVGGHDDLRRHLGLAVKDKSATTYAPILAIFGTTALMAAALLWSLYPGFEPLRWAEWFVAFSMCALAIQKLRDVNGFANGFLGYDLLAQRYVPYASIYPFAEAFAGIGMIAVLGAGTATWFVWPVALVALFIGSIGAVSVIKAVYIDKRDLKCACVGGDSNVPLGAISLTENVMMAVMSLWMIGKAVI